MGELLNIKQNTIFNIVGITHKNDLTRYKL
jgi:hypothetical protein